MFKSYGKIIVNPKAKNLETKKNGFWLILECADSISEYYRYLINKNDVFCDNKNGYSLICRNPKLTRSAWGTHISIVRNEEPKNKFDFSTLNGKIIHFEYNPEKISNNGKHWWMPVFSDDFFKIRNKLGLTDFHEYFCWGDKCGAIDCNKDPKFFMIKKHNTQFHLTIGHRTDWSC